MRLKFVEKKKCFPSHDTFKIAHTRCQKIERVRKCANEILRIDKRITSPVFVYFWFGFEAETVVRPTTPSADTYEATKKFWYIIIKCPKQRIRQQIH